LAFLIVLSKFLKFRPVEFSIWVALRSFARTSVPIRPLVGFGIPTLESGNNSGTLTVPFPLLLCLCVPSRACKSLKVQIKVLCHGRGREFEFVVDKFVGDPAMDWHMKENGPGVMVIEPKCSGRTYLLDPENAEDLEFVVRG
jgi:hypothetical protein